MTAFFFSALIQKEEGDRVEKTDGFSCDETAGKGIFNDGSGTDIILTGDNKASVYGFRNSNGIIYFEWVSPIAAGRLLNADVPLLPFEEVMQRFRSSIAASYLPINTVGNVDEYRLTIDRIEFGYTRVAMPDRQSVGMLVPSWGFYGVEKDYYRNAAATQQILDEDNCHMQDTPGHCFLTINAIDGSVIDRMVGY